MGMATGELNSVLDRIHAWGLAALMMTSGNERLPQWARNAVDRLLASPLGKRLVKGMFWSLAGAVARRGFALLGSVVVARMVSTDAYGQLGMVRSTINMLGPLAGFGLGTTACKFVAELHEAEPERAGRITWLSVAISAAAGAIMTVVLALAAPWLAREALGTVDLATTLRLAAPWLLLFALSSVERGILAGYEQFGAIARVSLGVGIAQIVLMVAGTHFWGIRGAVVGQMLARAADWLLSGREARKAASRASVVIVPRGWKDELPVLWRFSLPVLLSAGLPAVAQWAGQALVAQSASGYRDIAIYSVANQWWAAILFVPTAMATILLPMMSSATRKGVDERRRILRTNLLMQVGCALVLGIGVLTFSRVILAAYGPDYLDGRLVFSLVCLSTIPGAVSRVLGYVLWSAGRAWLGMVLELAGSVVYTGIVAVVLASAGGSLALGWATLAAHLVLVLAQAIAADGVMRSAEETALAATESFGA